MKRTAALLGLAQLLASAPAVAEVWGCNFPHKLHAERFEVRGQFLFDRSGLPYHLLANDRVGLVAVLGEAIDPADIGLKGPKVRGIIVESDTIAIDRKTGHAVRGYVSVAGPPKLPIKGQCRLR